MNDAIKTFEHANRTVEIHFDPEPMNPREMENLCHMSCWHRRVNLGDDPNSTLGGMSEEEVITYVKETERETIIAILPLYLYQHSGMTISTSPFGDRWDSGQVGWAYITQENAHNMGCEGAYPGPEGGTWDQARMEEHIRGEVEAYDQFLTGEMYGYIVKGQDDATLESCWGFYDEDDCISKAKSAAEHSTDPAVEALVEELASRATYAGVAP